LTDAARPGHREARIDELERVPLAHGSWLAIRRTLGLTGVAVNAYAAERAGDTVIEPHDETSAGAGGHEELYVVLRGGAVFEIGGERIDAPAGALIAVDPGVHRAARATADGTIVLVTGGKPGAALPVSPFEHWYAAQPAYEAGDYARAIAIAEQGLADFPRHGTLHYHHACYRALAGATDAAIEHLRIAFEEDPRTRDWAAEDSDLDSLRERAGYPA
jgi:mannose-6-phosphate isomerase-like protein (cupin superfamily)